MAYGADLARLEFWARPQDERHQVFAKLRATGEPVFVEYPRPGQPVDGFYALPRHAEILEVSRSPQVFSSEPTSTSLDDPPSVLRDYVGSMISLDDPRHARLRRIVSRAFTPRMIKKFEDDVSLIAAQIVDNLAERGPCDFVTEVAMPLPLTIICAMMGIPESAYGDVIEATNVIIAMGDPDYVGPDGQDRASVLIEKFSFLHALMGELAQARRAHPSDDLVTALVHADVAGESLTERELGKFFG